MCFLVRIAAILFTGGVLAGQGAALPVPANIEVDGVPPIPSSIASKLAPYGRFRRATLLAWHPAKRSMLVSTTTAAAPQVHVVESPGSAPSQLTTSPQGVPGAASYSPLGGDWFVYRKDTGAAETHQLWRFSGEGDPVRLRDGK